MEDDVDIYADLPSLDLIPVKNDQDCNCKELKKELDSLASKLENMQKIKTNLEKNLSSLLKTAKAEISRKDKMINDLRKQLDDVTFRRSNRSEASGSSTHRLPRQHSAKYENVPWTHSQESETESHEIQFHHDDYKSRKPQTDVNRIPTLFGERLQKRLMENEEEEKKQKAMLKLVVEVKSADIPENNVVENDKEIGSQFGTNDNNESNIERCSNSEPPDREPYKKKRTNEEDDTRRHKRLKMENNEDKTTTEDTDHNYLTRYAVTDNSAQYENKDGPVKFENRPNAGHSFKKEEISFYTGRRASSEYRDTKQDRNCTNGWRSYSKNNSTKDHDSSNVKNDLVDGLRNSRTSNYVSERFNIGYKKNEYSHRHSPPRRRSYSRSRSDYESSSSHRLRERSSRTYREKKYDDYISRGLKIYSQLCMQQQFDQDCNCKELKKELDSLSSKLENMQKIKTNLEKNLSSLLKTAKAEISRKDKMINDLRKQLDDVTFRRSNRREASGSSTHRLPRQHSAKYENVPWTHSQENETESHEIQFHHDDYKSRKPQTDVNRIPTLFGERLQKRLMENEEEEKKQKAMLKVVVEVKSADIPENNVVENDKEIGSQFGTNDNNESNIERCSNSEPPDRESYKKKRTNEEDDTRGHKRLKMENNEDKTTTEETDRNYLTRYAVTDNSAQYENKDGPVKFENRPNAEHSFKKEEVSFYTGRRASSEYRDTKQDRNCTNGWRSYSKNNSTKDHDSSNVKNDLVDGLRNSRTSNYVSERINNGYKKNEYSHRHSPPRRRSYSRSRSDYESSSSNRLRSSRTYREKKYDDYIYDSRYKNERLKKNRESEESDGKTRYRRGERDVLRDRSRYLSDVEDRESSSSYKNKKYENHRIKKETENVLNDKKLHESNKAAAETNSRKSSSRTNSAGKNIEHKEKNESKIKSKNSIENTSVCVAMKDLEEGEILDSPENKNNSIKISDENNVKSVSVEDKNEDISVNVFIDDKSIRFKNDVNSTEVADISTKKIEVAPYLQQNLYNCRKNEDTCKSHINKDLMDSVAQNIGAIEQVHDSDIDDNDKNDADKTSNDFITDTITETVVTETAVTETAVIETAVAEIAVTETAIIETAESAKIKETTADIENVTKIKELDDSSDQFESATKKEEIDNPNIESVVEITEVNNFNIDNSIHEIDGDELKTSTAKFVTKVEAVLNCDIEDRDKSQAPIESETFHQTSSKSNVETCLNDHNYVQSPSIDVSDLGATKKSPLKSECGEAVPETTTTSKETKAEKTINVQSVNSVKRTVSSTVKNKKDQQSKGILISHRRKAVILSDSNASMTVLMNANVAKTSSIINNCNDNDSTLKPRACKISRVTAKTCK
ncbi:uncharacterized protein LOC143900649 [Temnothorax americanus]|uniref:uncharacterized protein LOC143900649 n=1 Tax=Temnothorax americanus TaxID=1964332 RepID=UPI0040695B49